MRSSTGGAKPKRVRLKFERPFSSCRLVVNGALVLHRFCFPRKGSAEIGVWALDGDVVVAHHSVVGEVGEVVTVTLISDRISRVRLTGGPAAVVEFCVRPVSLGSFNDWQPVPDCPQPLPLPIIHPDYPAQNGPEDLNASRQQARSRIIYGPSAPWAAEFEQLYRQLRALVV